MWEEAHSTYASSTADLLENLLERLSLVALQLTPANCSVGAGILAGFGNHLTPLELKLQIERSFGIELTGSEVIFFFFCLA